MKTLEEHAHSLARVCVYSENEILDSIKSNTRLAWGDNLLVWSVEDMEGEKVFDMLWTDGNGKEIYPVLTALARAYGCQKIHAITRRPKAAMRKYKGFHEIGTLIEMEVR